MTVTTTPRTELSRAELLGDTLRRLVRRRARTNTSNLLGKVRPEDVAMLLRGLTPAERLWVFRILIEDYPDSAGDVLTELEGPMRLSILERLTPEEIAGILELVEVDDAVFLVESLPPELREKVLEVVDLRDLTEVQSHLTYPDDTAGRIMTSEFFALPESTTVRDAIAAIQEKRDVEMIFYLYVVDDQGRLAGVTSLRQLLLSPPETSLREMMQRDVIKVHTDTDQEEVAQLAARYDFLAVPVVDDEDRLVGIVTLDDIVDVVKEEATEDILKMVGTTEDELLYQERSLRVAGIRLPWLLVNLVGGVVTGLLLEHFQVTLSEALFLLTFVPVIMGMGGNIGTQTSTITVRGLATGRLVRGEGRIRPFLWQQMRVGAVLGMFCGLMVAGGAVFLEKNIYYGVVVGAAMTVAMTLAAVNGALIPLLFERLGIDPAVAAGPLVTTSNDLTGILIYFSMASVLIDFLVR